MRESQTPFAVARHDRLSVFAQVAFHCIADVSHAHVALKSRKVHVVENFARKSLVFYLVQVSVVVGYYAAALLSAVLKREHSVVEHASDVESVVIVKTEHAAFFA